jgi:CheY-like chemotaxis protein/HPt (histidine-containing phosphotransfer) domain-containing protein
MIMTRTAPTKPLDILVVEDLPTSQKLFDLILRAAGYEVRCAANGLEAIRQFREAKPDLIVMDMQMPFLDGWQTSRILRVFQSSQSPVPIIATTAHGPAFDRERFSSIGVDAFLPKPIEAAKLIRLVDQLLAKNSDMPDGEKFFDDSSDGGLDDRRAGEPPVDIPATMARLNNDRQLLATLVGFFYEDYPPLLEAIREGVAQGDGESVRRAAHSLKGLAANFGAAPTVSVLQEQESGRGDLEPEEQQRLLKEAEANVALLAAALVDYHAASQEPTP